MCQHLSAAETLEVVAPVKKKANREAIKPSKHCSLGLENQTVP